jgi:cytochrome c oxidase assembly factor CtaG
VSAEAHSPSREWVAPFRKVLAVAAPVLWVAALVPPMWGWAGRYEFVQAIQFAVFAFAVPALIVTGAPWRALGLASSSTHVVDADGRRISPAVMRFVDRVAATRSKSSHQQRAILAAGLFIALTVLWRSAPLVDFIVVHQWMTLIESASLVVMGTIAFGYLAESPPLTPGTSNPYRICIAAAIMWTAWVVAYLDGMSHSSWYHEFHHVAGRGVSLSADQQLSAAFIWLISGAVFVPVIFWNLVYWLKSEEDPNEEMARLVRDERTRGFFGTN